MMIVLHAVVAGQVTGFAYGAGRWSLSWRPVTERPTAQSWEGRYAAISAGQDFLDSGAVIRGSTVVGRESEESGLAGSHGLGGLTMGPSRFPKTDLLGRIRGPEHFGRPFSVEAKTLSWIQFPLIGAGTAIVLARSRPAGGFAEPVVAASQAGQGGSGIGGAVDHVGQLEEAAAQAGKLPHHQSSLAGDGGPGVGLDNPASQVEVRQRPDRSIV